MATPELHERIRDRIRKSGLWSEKSRQTTTHFYGLRCPECGRAEAWAYVEAPFSINCNRKNQCGARVKTLDLFPELVKNVEKDYPPTRSDPHRPAREYLHSRGLSRSLGGLRFEYWKNIRKTGGGGVMFFVGLDESGREAWNGRLFSPPAGEGKTHNQGSTRGLFWRHPGLSYDPALPTYVVEGVIDALSLIEMGSQAIAVLSSGQDPEGVDLGDLARNLVIAFDPDSAGAGGLRRWKEKYPGAGAITPVSGDWNDFLVARSREAAAKAFGEKMEEFRCRAALLLAESAEQYARTFAEHYGYPPGLFPFDKCYWYAFRQKKAARSGEVGGDVGAYRCSNFTLTVDHYQLDAGAGDDSTYRYHLVVRHKSGSVARCSVTGSELSTPGAIRSALLTKAKVMWEGEAKPSAGLAKLIVDAGAPVVRQCYMLGIDQQSNCAMFPDFAVDPKGEVVLPDKQGFFRASRKEYLRAASLPAVRPRKGMEPGRIYELIARAWPENGPLAYAYTAASWFVNVIKPELGFFPFFSLHGDTQTGKTRLVRTLNALQCLDEEGLPMTKLNTGKGEIRKLAQRSGLFKALLEGNKEDKLRFDLESLLTLYNYGNHLQVRAMKTNDIQTQETGFLGTLVFVQNKEPFTGKAQMERVISSKPFKTGDITPETAEAFNQLIRVPIQELAYTYVEIMRQRERIESGWAAEYAAAREEMFGAIPDNRIAENYGLILAFHRIVTKLLVVHFELTPFFFELARVKHDRCVHRQATLADSFFEAVNELSDAQKEKCLELTGDGRLLVKLPLALKTLDGLGYRFIQAQVMQELKEHPAFVASRLQYRGHFGEQASQNVRVWAFDASKIL